MGTQESVKPAFYALRGGGWRDYITLLHPPYTLWHLSYVALGAGLAPRFHLDRMLWALAAFFLAMGVASHALDELKGRPLRTAIPSPALVGLGAVSLAGAVAIGVVAVPAYNLELALHNGFGFALLWGAFPALTGYFVEAQTLRLEAFAAAAFAFATSLAQRTLSTPVRRARREHATTEGIAPLERSLRLLAWALSALAVAIVAARLR